MTDWATPQRPEAPRRRGSPKYLMLGCALFMVFLAVGAVSFGLSFLKKVWDVGPASAALDKHVAAAKAAGVPLEAKDLAPRPAVGADEDAAPLIRDAVDGISMLADSEESRVYAAAGSGEADPAEAEETLQRVSRFLDLAEEAARKPRCDFKRDWDLGHEVLFPDLAGIKKLSRLLSARAMLKARREDHPGALQDLRAAYRLSLHAASDPALIPLLVSIACQAITVAGVERCLALAEDPQDLRAYAEFLEEGGPPQDVLRMLRGEAFAAVATVRNLTLHRAKDAEGEPIPLDPSKLKRNGMPEEARERALMSRLLDMWTAILGAAKNEGDPSATLVAAAHLSEDHLNRPGVSSMMLEDLTPLFRQTADAYRRDVAQWRVAAALARVLEFKAARGRFQSDLAEIHADARDPFGGGGLHYKSDARSVRVYSVGPDRVDNGGLQRHQVESALQGFDVVASYPPSITRDSANILPKR